jgi:acylphosphatase
MAKRVHLYVSGRVQGVSYRYYAISKARELNLSGWVQNLPCGRVELLAEGEEEALKLLVEWCHRGSPEARVENVEVMWEAPQQNLQYFSAKYY